MVCSAIDCYVNPLNTILPSSLLYLLPPLLSAFLNKAKGRPVCSPFKRERTKYSNLFFQTTVVTSANGITQHALPSSAQAY